jgi:ABC-2 type transport system permease protein
MRGFFLQAPFFLAFFAPAISMGLLSEEQRSRTLELLMTMPVTDLDIVLGKFFAALTLLLLVIGATLPYAVSLSMMGDLDWGPIVGGYLGLGLLGCTYLSLGLMISSWTRDQVVSVLVAFFLCFALSVMGNLAEHAPPWLARVLNALSTSAHFQNIARGVIDTRDIIYYLSMTVVSLGAATVTLGRRRW